MSQRCPQQAGMKARSSSTRQSWRLVGECRSRGFGTTPASALRRMIVSPAYGWDATSGSSGAPSGCNSGSTESASDNIFILHFAKQVVRCLAWGKRKTHTHRRSAILGERRERRSCPSPKSPRLPARAGRHELRVYRLRDAVRLQQRPLPPANTNEHNSKERGRAKCGLASKKGK